MPPSKPKPDPDAVDEERNTALDPFRPDESSGLPAKAIVTVEPFFGFNPNYRQGKALCLLFRGTVSAAYDDNDDPIDLDLDENPFQYACGGDPGEWATTDGGETATHAKRTKFHVQSGVGSLLKAALDLNDPDLDKALQSRGSSQLEAGIWRDLTFEFERVEFDFGTRKIDGKDVQMKRASMMPVRFIGEGVPDETTPEAPARKSAAKPPAKPTAKKAAEPEQTPDDEAAAENEAGGGILAKVDVKIKARLKAAFNKAAGDEGKFIDIAADINEVSGDDGLMEALTGGTLYAELAVAAAAAEAAGE